MSTDQDSLDVQISGARDYLVLVNVGGRERTRTDFEDVCHRAGLSITAVIPLPEAAPFSLIEAVADR